MDGLLNPEDEDIKILLNVRNYSANDMASYRSRTESPAALM
jgi:hypothetical protein